MSQRRFTGGKIVIFGAPGVGKTAFAVRYITKRYIGDYESNKEMMYTHKLSTARDDIVLEILDTASNISQETLEKHIKWADGFVLIYSVTERDSFLELGNVKDTIEKLKGNEIPIILVANKSDLLSAREITEEEGMDFAGKIDCPKFEISVAESVQGVNESMEEILCQLKRDYIKSLSASNMQASLDKPKSKLFSMKKAFKKRINRSHSDTF